MSSNTIVGNNTRFFRPPFLRREMPRYINGRWVRVYHPILRQDIFDTSNAIFDTSNTNHVNHDSTSSSLSRQDQEQDVSHPG